MLALAAVKHWARIALAYALYYTGVLHGLKRMRLRGRAVVLMYHRVLPAAERQHSFSSDAIIVEPATFARHLVFLRRHFRVLSPEDFSERLAQRSAFPDASCLVTFDDGWIDNYTHALPLLARHAIPAVIFLPTEFVGKPHGFWQEQLGRALYRLYQRYQFEPSILARAPDAPILASVFRGPAGCAKRRISDYVRTLKARPEREVAQLRETVDGLLASADAAPSAQPDRFLGWDEARSMLRAGVRFGSHACTHRMLPRLSDDELQRELVDSKQQIERMLGRPVPLVAFPNGDFDSRATDAARRAGYIAAFTTRPGPVGNHDDPYTLRRINIHERATSQIPLFYATLLGVL